MPFSFGSSCVLSFGTMCKNAELVHLHVGPDVIVMSAKSDAKLFHSWYNVTVIGHMKHKPLNWLILCQLWAPTPPCAQLKLEAAAAGLPPLPPFS